MWSKGKHKEKVNNTALRPGHLRESDLRGQSIPLGMGCVQGTTRRGNGTPEEARDWASLPRDVLVKIFLRLGPCREIMRGAERACTAWRRTAVDEPVLWRRIDIATVLEGCSSRRVEMARAAANRSRGQCEAFAGPVDEDSLLYLVERTPLLKSLHISYGKVGSEILKMALQKLTLLEDLEISSFFSGGKKKEKEIICLNLSVKLVPI